MLLFRIVIAKVLLKGLIHPFRLTVSLGVEGGTKLTFNTRLVGEFRLVVASKD